MVNFTLVFDYSTAGQLRDVELKNYWVRMNDDGCFACTLSSELNCHSAFLKQANVLVTPANFATAVL